MAPKKMSAAVAAAAASAQQAPSDDKLNSIRKKLREAAQLDLEINDLEAQLTEKQQARSLLLTKTLPDMFAEARIDSLGLEPDGNMPGYDAEVNPFYSAKLPDDEKQASAAYKKFKWLSELARNTYTVKLGKGTAKQAKALAAFLKKSKIPYTNKVGVLPQSLTAEIRRRFEDGEPLAPADMTLLGAHTGTVIKLTKRKDK